MEKFVQINHPMYRPLWVRLLIVIATALWAYFEYSQESGFWFALAAGACAFCAYTFLLTYKLPPDKPDQTP